MRNKLFNFDLTKIAEWSEAKSAVGYCLENEESENCSEILIAVFNSLQTDIATNTLLQNWRIQAAQKRWTS